VLHACRKIKELREADADIREDYKNLYRLCRPDIRRSAGPIRKGLDT
jgi:hypothetical protein